MMIARRLRTLALFSASLSLIAVAACAPPEDDADSPRAAFDLARGSMPEVALLLEGGASGTVQSLPEGTGWLVLPPATPASAQGGTSVSPGWASPRRSIAAELGPGAADPMFITVDGRRRVGVRYRGAAGAPGASASGAVFFSHVAPGAHAAWVPRGRDVEELLLVERPDVEVVYDLDLPPGSTLHQPLPDLVEVREGRRAWLRMRFDDAWAEGERTPRILVAVEGSAVHVRAESDAWPVVVDPTWQTTDEMAQGRYLHTVTLLDTGDVLIAGGRAADYLDTAELFSADLGGESGFTVLGKMTEPRASHTATLLPDGRVLLAGSDRSGPYVATAELYDPETSTFTATEGAMSVGRAHHTATLLQSGEVLIFGGAADSQSDLYSPGINAFSPIAAPAYPGRHYHTATRLPDGKVLIVGGEAGTEVEATLTIAEVYDPKTKTFSTLPEPTAQGRVYHAATLLPNGDVLFTGGRPTELGPLYNTAEIYRPDVGFTLLDSTMSLPRAIHVSELLPDGKVLLAGGSPLAPWCDVFEPRGDPLKGTFSRTADLPAAHNVTAGSRVGQGRVFIVGTGPDASYKGGAVYVPGTLGLSCGGSGECENGFCVDSVC